MSADTLRIEQLEQGAHLMTAEPYLTAASQVILDARFQHLPRYAERGLGALMAAMDLTQEEFRAFLNKYIVGPKVNPARQGYFVLRARRLLTERCDFVDGEPKTGPLSLNADEFPSLDVETTQNITRLASIQWLAQVNAEGRAQFIQTIDAELTLTEDEKILLNELLLRPGHIFSTNAKTATPHLDRKTRNIVLVTLARKINKLFGEAMITWHRRQVYYEATDKLIAEVPGLSIDDLISTHEERFGPHLPLSAYLFKTPNFSGAQKIAALNAVLENLETQFSEVAGFEETHDRLMSAAAQKLPRSRPRKSETLIRVKFSKNGPHEHDLPRGLRQVKDPLPDMFASTEELFTFDRPPEKREPTQTIIEQRITERLIRRRVVPD